MNLIKGKPCCAISKETNKQCASIAKNTEFPSFCTSHREVFKYGRTLTAVDGSVWTSDSWNKHRSRFFTGPNATELVEPVTYQPPAYGTGAKSPPTKESLMIDEIEETDTPEVTLPDAVRLRIREAEAIPAVMAKVAELGPEAAARVLQYITLALGITTPAVTAPKVSRPYRAGAALGITTFVRNHGKPISIEDIAQAMAIPLPKAVKAVTGCVNIGHLHRGADGKVFV